MPFIMHYHVCHFKELKDRLNKDSIFRYKSKAYDKLTYKTKARLSRFFRLVILVKMDSYY